MVHGFKRNDKATDGAKNLFFLMKSSEEIQCPEMKDIVQRIIQRNAFFADTKNILLVMLSDSDEATRKNAIDIIISSRVHYQKYSHNEVPNFRMPMINFKAQ